MVSFFLMLSKINTIRVLRVRSELDICRFLGRAHACMHVCMCVYVSVSACLHCTAPASWPLASLLPVLSHFWPHSSDCLGIIPTCVAVLGHGPVPTENWTEAIYHFNPALQRWRRIGINPATPKCCVFICPFEAWENKHCSRILEVLIKVSFKTE